MYKFHSSKLTSAKHALPKQNDKKCSVDGQNEE
jgi:hypothetical protein